MGKGFEYIEQEIVIPPGLEPLVLDPDLSGFVLFEQFECNVAEDGVVLWAMVFAAKTLLYHARSRPHRPGAGGL